MADIGLPHVGDKNTDFQIVVEDTDVNGVTAILNISGATTLQMFFRDPIGNTYGPFTASFLTTGVDGIMRYINSDPTGTGVNLNVGGFWTYWGKVIFSDGGEFTTSDNIVEVLDNAN